MSKKLNFAAVLMTAAALSPSALAGGDGSRCFWKGGDAHKTAAAAETPIPKTLGGAEIRELLAGKSALYEDGARQFFAADGKTSHQIPGRPSEYGKWRVSADRYCSSWGGYENPGAGGETCYEVKVLDGRVTWNDKHPAEVRPGDVFNGGAKTAAQ